MESKLKLFCKIPGHKNSPIITLCCNQDCELQTMNCIICLLTVHQECNESMISLKDLNEAELGKLSNWYHCSATSNLAALLQKQKEGGLANWG